MNSIANLGEGCVWLGHTNEGVGWNSDRHREKRVLWKKRCVPSNSIANLGEGEVGEFADNWNGGNRVGMNNAAVRSWYANAVRFLRPSL